MATPPTQNAKPESALISWKEIAAFLNRAERTVKRWERERGLPVHRVPGGERPGVYAYPSELTDWLAGKSGELEGDDRNAEKGETGGDAEPGAGSDLEIELPPVTVAGQGGRLRIPRWARLAVIGMVVALAGAGIYASSSHSIGSWIERRVPLLAGIGLGGSHRQVVAAVSDPERALAHDLYLRGRFEWNQRTPESLNRALDDFTQAVVHNPNDAHAYAGLADSYEMLFIYGSRQDDDARDKAMAAAKKAAELDGSLSEAHRALGYAAWRSGNISEAETELNLAIRLDPKDPLAHVWLSNVLASHGEDGQCLAELAKAQELDPASASILAIKGDRLYWTGREEEGLALLNEAVRSEPKLGIAHWYLAAIAFDRRDYPMYLKESQTTAEARNDGWLKDVTARLSAAYARGGERDLLNAEFAVQESCSPPAYPLFLVARTQKAMTCLAKDRKPEALRLLEEASANHDKEFEDLKSKFISGDTRELREHFPALASDPRFEALMKQKSDPPKQDKLRASADSGTL